MRTVLEVGPNFCWKAPITCLKTHSFCAPCFWASSVVLKRSNRAWNDLTNSMCSSLVRSSRVGWGGSEEESATGSENSAGEDMVRCEPEMWAAKTKGENIQSGSFITPYDRRCRRYRKFELNILRTEWACETTASDEWDLEAAAFIAQRIMRWQPLSGQILR